MSDKLIPKNQMSEEDIKNNYINPALQNKGWEMGEHILLEKCFTDGRIDVRGEKAFRQKRKYTDYLLHYNKSKPLAVIEAKKNTNNVGSGIQQAIEYAEILDVPFAYSSNGDGFLEHDMITGLEKEFSINEFPTREELWIRYQNEANLSEKEKEIINIPYHYEMGSKKPRYYQKIAINKTVEAVAKGDKRIMFVMATGTGKTFVAFQIIHRLMKSKLIKKVLFLADRNILVDQTMIGDFRSFGNKMVKIDQKLLSKTEIINSYEIYLALYQQLVGNNDEESQYKKFGKDFFDLIIVDEAHRGSASEESNWRRILDYFSSATQIGMTATPKEDKNTSNSKYFGKPIYTYSLKQGIEDGFLAPYRVIKVNMDIDIEGYRPEKGKIDIHGEQIPDKIYDKKDFDKVLIVDDRTKKVASYVTNYLKSRNSRFEKTIFFCENIDHAERMRQALNNENSDLVAKNPKYIMRITGDNQEGKEQLDNFVDPDSKYPSLVTTSKLLTTGVNIKTCKLIVLDSNIGSMTEFKQIIGRGTRIDSSRGKDFFTIIDFRNVTSLFADPNFDGEPVVIIDSENEYEDKYKHSIISSKSNIVDSIIESSKDQIKYRVNDKEVKIINDQIQVIGTDGKLIIEDLTDYTRKNILGEYATLNDFSNAWKSRSKKDILKELNRQGVFLKEIRTFEKINSKEMDDFDLILMIAYQQPPLTKIERINNVKKRGFLYKYSKEAQKVLEALLNKYLDTSIVDIESIKILKTPEFEKFGGLNKIINETFGNKNLYEQAIIELQNEIYKNL
ncbi:DEAD/DEAH box helicase family protein [Ureaplasma parvum]|uniref:EcoAI/FtnUII family type I restriction enzme subunit R n=1 Tax=Ureaplasma parvum TaxID=134821 RepID=UPI00307EEFD0